MVSKYDQIQAARSGEMPVGPKSHHEAVTASMEADGFYASHTREECKAEWARRYVALAGDAGCAEPAQKGVARNPGGHVFALDGNILHVRETICSFRDTKVSHWYYDVENWQVSSHGRAGDLPDRAMTEDDIAWVKEHYLPKVDWQELPSMVSAR